MKPASAPAAPARASDGTKVCHLTSVHHAFDARIFHKECQSLARAGFDVSLIAPHDGTETRMGIRVEGVVKHPNRFHRMTRTVWAVYQRARQVDARVYHFHDPELFGIALLLKLRRKLVIFDVHEDMPATMFKKAWLRRNIVRRFVSRLSSLIETFSNMAFDGIVAATPDIGTRFRAGKTEVVHNYPTVSLIDGTPRAHAEKPTGTTVFAFAGGHSGGLTRDRGVKEVVSAIGCLGETSELWLMGDWESEEFRLECSSVAGFARCRHLGYLPLSHVYGRLKQADVGLAVLHPEKSYLRAIPTKAFDYMATSLPVIMSDFPLWRRLFHDCALFVNPLDTEDIAEKMTTLARNPDLRLKLGTAGRRRVESQCSWEAEVPKLIRLYERLVGQGAPGR